MRDKASIFEDIALSYELVFLYGCPEPSQNIGHLVAGQQPGNTPYSRLLQPINTIVGSRVHSVLWSYILNTLNDF